MIWYDTYSTAVWYHRYDRVGVSVSRHDTRLPLHLSESIRYLSSHHPLSSPINQQLFHDLGDRNPRGLTRFTPRVLFFPNIFLPCHKIPYKGAPTNLPRPVFGRQKSLTFVFYFFVSSFHMKAGLRPIFSLNSTFCFIPNSIINFLSSVHFFHASFFSQGLPHPINIPPHLHRVLSPMTARTTDSY